MTNSCTEATLRKINRVVGKNLEPEALRPGERTNFEGKAISNQILLGIPHDEFAVIRGAMHYLDLPHYTVLHEPRKKLEYAYFLNSGMASLVFKSNGGESVEVGVIGSEGFVPIPAAAGMRHSPHEAIMQVGGDGFSGARRGTAGSARAQSTTAELVEPLCHYSWNTDSADGRLQPAARSGPAAGALAAADSGPSRFRTAEDHARFSGHDAGDRSSEREPGRGLIAQETHHRVLPRVC